MQFLTKQLYKGVNNFMNNFGSGNNPKDQELIQKLGTCTYTDETKYSIQKAIKQCLHVYPFFNIQVLIFTEGGYQRRHIELKGILEMQIKGKTCKVDFNMMIPHDYPRVAPFVRIINRNPDYQVDQFYASLKSKNDNSSYVLNEKLETCRNWNPSSSLVNVIIECYDIMKARFPFSKPHQQGSGGNPWDNLYKNTGSSNNNGWGNNNNNYSNNYGNNNNNNGQWGFNNPNNNNGWANNNNNNNNWVNNNNNSSWGNTNNNSWGQNNNNNQWGNNNNNNWQNNNMPNGGIGGMGGMHQQVYNVNNNIASAQKMVGTQKKNLQQLSSKFTQLLQKNQALDMVKKSIESESNFLQKENYSMSTFLKESESSQILDLSKLVVPKDEISEHILELSSSLKARQDCLMFLESKFNDEEVNLDTFMKQLRKIEEARFIDKVLIHKCLKQSH